MYTITVRTDLNLLDIAWSGVFTPETAIAYAWDVETAFAQAGFEPGYLLRIDMSATSVQPQSGVMALHEVMRGFPAASRIAIIAPSAVTRLQVRRLMKQPYLRIFDTAEEGFAWLTEEATPVCCVA
jgi:hypothetical protein